MTVEKSSTHEGLASWLSSRPYWERYLWKLCLERDALTPTDLNLVYTHLCKHVQIVPTSESEQPSISFKEGNAVIASSDVSTGRIKLVEVKGFKNVNALSDTCSIQLGANLTLIFGANGSGKSGIGRLLGNACFSRGEREILPNVKNTTPTLSGLASATFSIEDEAGQPKEIDYTVGEQNETLKRFSVFDAQSVLIHLDESNNVNFTPAQVVIYDKVAEALAALDEMLIKERNARRTANPFQSMFLTGESSATAVFLKQISAETTDEDFLKHCSFEAESDGNRSASLEAQINEKKKLDIPNKRTQLTSDCENLEALKASLEIITGSLSASNMAIANALMLEIAERKKVVERLGATSFDDGLFACVGTDEWKALIRAAKSLYDKEQAARTGKDISHCLLCHQELNESSQSLFYKYWEFLQSKSETELRASIQKHDTLLSKLRSVKSKYPQFLSTDAGVKSLSDYALSYLEELKRQFQEMSQVIDDWIARTEKLEMVDRNNVPTVDLTKIDEIVVAKQGEKAMLVDPSGEIAILTAELRSLQHRKEASSVKNAALEYLNFFRWSAKANRANLASVKMLTTKKRTETFLATVAKNYKGLFNQELAKLGCEFNLMMNTSGEQGDTKKEYRLDFAKTYSPSRILSEGEQNACSLADFVTEAQLDEKNCGIVFDDPVTSLDHERKAKIAERLTALALTRQVVILTHDISFASLLATQAEEQSVPFVAHWITRANGTPGFVRSNTSPKLATVAALRKDCHDAIVGYDSFEPKRQEQALGVAFDYLRSACEGLIEEFVFNRTMRRWEDQVRVQNLEEAIFDQDAALKIVNLHGKISEVLLAHNRSPEQRENQPSLSDLNALMTEFDKLKSELQTLRSAAKKAREVRKEAKEKLKGGW
jgi:hypothetical protein